MENFKREVRGRQECHLNWDRIEGDWKLLVGKVKEKWSKLADDDIAAMNGMRERLEGKIRELYGHGKSQVRKDVDDWHRIRSLK
jgi:uncharacterized protein YjbJ (UPF0337 family)